MRIIITIFSDHQMRSEEIIVSAIEPGRVQEHEYDLKNNPH